MNQDSLLGMQFDEYRLEALLGRGGMARVYRGLDTGLNRPVAVKVIDTPFRADADYLRRFTSEAQAIARLDHPHVVRLYRYGQANGMLYMAMQFIEGVDLGYLFKSYRQDGEFIPPSDALQLVRELGAALDYIHSHGIIHRDVKPSNIMLTRAEARGILTDFGLALQADVGTLGEVFGSPHYIAPEQAISSAKAIPQSDLYALGVILYEMFTGQLPFQAENPVEVADLQVSSPPPPPRTVRPELSAEVEAVILKALEKNPEKRYPSGQALADALERALSQPAEATIPAHHSVPERVTIAFAASTLAHQKAAARSAAVTVAASKSPVPAESLPAEPPAPTLAQPADPAAAEKKPANKTMRWTLLGAGALVGLCLFACLITAGLSFLLYRNIPAAGMAPETPARMAETAAPAQPAPAEDYRLKLWRCSGGSCLVVINTGSGRFPLTSLKLEGNEGSLEGQDWGAQWLEPGECINVVKSDERLAEMPAGADCQLAGIFLLEEENQKFLEADLTIFFNGQGIYDFSKTGRYSEILIPR